MEITEIPSRGRQPGILTGAFPVYKRILKLNSSSENLRSDKSLAGPSKAATWKFFLLGGEIDKKASNEMATIHRGYPMLSSIELEWTEKEDAYTKEWMNIFHREMEPFASVHCYQNFIDLSQVRSAEYHERSAVYSGVAIGCTIGEIEPLKNKEEVNLIWPAVKLDLALWDSRATFASLNFNLFETQPYSQFPL